MASHKTHKGFINCSETDLAYMAGIFDGEGSLMMKTDKRTGNIYPVIAVEMAHLKTILFLDSKYQCSKISVTRRRKNLNHSTTYRWAIGHKLSIKFIEKILPYLLAKREEADIFIQFPYPNELGRKRRALSSAITSKRMFIKEELRNRKTKGKGKINEEIIKLNKERLAIAVKEEKNDSQLKLVI